jgi:threonine/homoserine/homoserine lactone efflux protein
MARFRSWQFVAAVVFSLAAVSFFVEDDGIRWMWAQTPVVGAVLAAAAIVFWVLLALRGSAADRVGDHGRPPSGQ